MRWWIDRSVSVVYQPKPSQARAQVDLNPHRVEAALFAFRSPLSRVTILADEVGLGKTIETEILLSQCWAERRRKLLVICPANLRNSTPAK